MLEQIVRGGEGEVVVEGGANGPISGVQLPVEVFEKVNYGFEWVVGVWFGVVDVVSEIGDEGFVVAVKEEVGSEGIEGSESDGSKWVRFGRIGNE